MSWSVVVDLCLVWSALLMGRQALQECVNSDTQRAAMAKKYTTATSGKKLAASHRVII